jgi:hypothetical protein
MIHGDDCRSKIRGDPLFIVEHTLLLFTVLSPEKKKEKKKSIEGYNLRDMSVSDSLAALKEQLVEETLSLQATTEKLEKQKQRLCDTIAEQNETLAGILARIGALQAIKEEMALSEASTEVSPALSPKTSFHMRSGSDASTASSGPRSPLGLSGRSAWPASPPPPTRVENLFAALEQSFATEADQLKQLLKKLEANMLPEPIKSSSSSLTSSLNSHVDPKELKRMKALGIHQAPPVVPPGTPTDNSDAKLASFTAKLRRTSIVVVSRNDVVGTKAHFDKHRKSCSGCAGRYKKWKEEHGRDKKPLGRDCAVPMREMLDGVQKNVVSAEIFLTAEPCIAERREYSSTPPIDFFRICADLACVKEEGAAAWSRQDATQLAVTMQQRLEQVLKSVDDATFTAARSPSATTTSSPVSPETAMSQEQEATKNNIAEVANAVDKLIRMLQYNISVTADREGAKGKFFFKVRVTTSMPAMTSVLEPLRELLSDHEKSREHFRALIAPLTKAIKLALPPSVATTLTDPSTVDFLARMSRIALSTTLSPAPGAAPSRVSEILEVLAMCHVSVRINARVPSLKHKDPNGAAAEIAISVLRHFTAPNEWEAMPRSNDKDLCDFTIVLDSCPTVLIEAYNKIFNSHEKLPDSARQSALDGLMSPAAKVSLGLKMFSELVVEVYRPFTPALETACEACRSKCTPKASLPPDIVTSCVEVDRQFRALISEIEQQRLEAASKSLLPTIDLISDADEGGAREVAKATAEGVESLQSMLNQHAIRIDSATSCCLQALLPTSLDLKSHDDLRRKLVYLHVQGHSVS